MQRYIRMEQLASTPGRQGMLPVAPSTIWRWVQRGEFPKPVKLGPQVTAWRSEEVENWIASKSFKGEDE